MNKLKLILAAALLSVFAVSANAQQSDNVVTATYGNATGNTTRTMTVALNHANDYVAFYLTLQLPEGTTVTGVTAKDPLKNGGTTDLSQAGGSATESTNFKVPFNHTSPTTCNIVGYNYGNEKIVGESGEILFTITLETEEGIAFDEGKVSCSYEFASLLSESLKGTVETDSRLWGDVNMDKVVDGKDYQMVSNKISSVAVTGEYDGFAADINEDNTLDGKDYQTISNIINSK